LSYKIREIDGGDNADILADIHKTCFKDTAKQVDYEQGYWWLAYNDKEPVAFAGITPSTLGFNTGYLKRVGVLPEHRGQGLQKRLIRVREARAKKQGWSRIVTDCTDNPASANSLYKAGYKMFTPTWPWAFDNSLYWTKNL
jgi:GNAT superfamily N-acetyltransferase